MIQKVDDFIQEKQMLKEKDKVVIGVSGGADSICLFFVLLQLRKKYNLQLVVVHVNHGIRGKEAKEDERFVEAICQWENIHFESVRKDVIQIAKKKEMTVEEAGREVRYKAFFEIAEKYNCNRIAVAHNKNDNAETILLNLFRGSGIKGLTGIPAVRDKIIRPLLCIERKEIEQYLNEKEIPFQIDKTNFDSEYTRNRVRLDILPYVIEFINTKAIEHMANTAQIVMQVQQYIEKNTDKIYDKIVIHKNGKYSLLVEDFIKEDIIIKKQVIFKMLEGIAGGLKDIEAVHIDAILELCEKQVGKELNLPYGISAVREYKEITLFIDEQKQEQMFFQKEVIVPGKVYLEDKQQYLSFDIIEYKENMIIPKNICTKWFDYDKIENTIFVRNRQQGDYMQINQQGGKKKLKDYFIDQKIPQKEREAVLLLVDGSHVMWIIGSRISEAYKIDKDTKKILEVKLNREESNQFWDGGCNNGRKYQSHVKRRRSK